MSDAEKMNKRLEWSASVDDGYAFFGIATCPLCGGISPEAIEKDRKGFPQVDEHVDELCKEERAPGIGHTEDCELKAQLDRQEKEDE